MRRETHVVPVMVFVPLRVILYMQDVGIMDKVFRRHVIRIRQVRHIHCGPVVTHYGGISQRMDDYNPLRSDYDTVDGLGSSYHCYVC